MIPSNPPHEEEVAICELLAQATIENSWPDPTPEMLRSAEFAAVWDLIKSWDIAVPGQYFGYCGANGNHVRAILDAIADRRTMQEPLDLGMGNVSQVDFGNLSDIPAAMEEMALEIRAGEHGTIATAAAVFWTSDGVPIVCGWGKDGDAVRSIGLLHAGATWLTVHDVRRK